METGRLKIEYTGYRGRFSRAKRFSCTLSDFDYLYGGDLAIGRFVVYFKKIDGIACYIFATISQGMVAWRVAFINGFQDRGFAYFKRLAVTIGDRKVWDVKGINVIPPRGTLTKGFGEESLYRQRINKDPVIPEWAHDLCKNTLNHYEPTQTVGPYEFFGLSGGAGPGGFRIAPYHGSWWKSWQGAALHARQMDGTTSRTRIACLDPNTGLPLEVPIEYNLTRNPVIELPGFGGDHLETKKWCRYEKLWTTPHWEGGWSSHDGQHLRRAVTNAMGLYDYNPWAQFWLGMVQNDCRMAYTMKRVAPRSTYYKPWHDTLWWKLANTEHHNACSWIGRTEAHVIMMAAFMNDHVEHWQTATKQIAMPNGMLNAFGPESWQLPDARKDPPGMTGRITQTFESMLLVEACRRIGMTDIADAAAAFIGPQPKWYVDVDAGEQANKKNGGGVPWYSVFTVENFDEFGGIPGFIQKAKMSSVGENPLDCLSPANYGILQE
jgi:hypothetical protein